MPDVRLECPCGHEFRAPKWGSGNCPKCSRSYQPTSDMGGYWVEFETTPGEWDD